MLVAIDPVANCSDTAYLLVSVAPNPSSSFTFTPNNQCAFQNVNFTNTSIGTYGATTYVWNFGNGNTATSLNAAQAYNGPGNYNVSLTVNNGPGCTSTSTQSVSVIDAPVVNISGDDGDGDLNYCLFPGDNTTSETVNFFNATTGATSYTWDFGDGSPPFTTSSNAALPHTYSTYGTFTVTMTATGSNGCQSVATLQVVFEKFVSASMTLNLTEYSGCAPHSLSTLTNLSVNATTFVWNFGDGSPPITTNNPIPPAYSYTTAGNYTISLNASNSCNSASATIAPIIIIDGPTANFTPSVTNGCAPQTITFTNQSTSAQPANNYQWNMGNGNTYSNVTTPPAQTYTSTGTYIVQLVAGNACGTDTITRTIIIDTIPTIDLVLDPITGCTPLSVNPTSTLLSGSNVSWQWYIDGVFTYTTPNDIPNQNFLSLNPNDSTMHTIRVTVFNGCGSSTDIDTVFVQPPVIANFTTQDTLCLGDAFSFTNLSSGTELSYSWDFGDGSPAVNTLNPSYTYSTSGNYTATLTTTGICGVDVAVFNVVVVDIPTIAITALPVSICAGESVTFGNTSSTDGSYLWNFGPNGSISSSPLYNPGSVIFTGTGTQTISFTINYAGCVASDFVLVDVNPLPVASFALMPASGCTPLTTSFTNTTIDTPGNTYLWDFGNGATSNTYIGGSQTYLGGLTDTAYSIQLLVTTAAGCSDSITQTALVSPLPNALVTILDDTLCLSESMLFANNSTGATSYLWNFGDGTSSSTISPAHTYATNGNFSASLVAYSTAGCTDTAFVDIFIDSIPTAAFVNTTECFGGTTVFTNNSIGSPVSYTWDFGDGSPTATTVNPTHAYGAAGNYLVTLTATNSVNCTHTIVQLVQVYQVPIPNFGWSQTCVGQQMNFSDLSLNSPIGWAWDFGDGGTSLVQNPTHLYVDTGAYQVQLIISGGTGCLDSITQNVYVDSIPTADFAFTSVCTNDLTVFTDNSTFSPDDYLWNFGDGNFSAVSNPSHTYTTAGTYSVNLMVSYAGNGCSNSISQTIEAYPRTIPAFVANVPCLGDSTNFQDLTGNAPTTWEWDFGDGSALETVENPTHLYGAMGLFDIELVTSNMYGCVDTLVQQIEIYGLPTADFTNTTVCEGAMTQFTDNSIDDVAWFWNFGEAGASSNLENPTYTYTTNGSFSPQLVVFNSVGCSDTIAYSVTVNPNPVAGFTADTACFGYLTSFTDASNSAISWIYDFGDASTSNLSDPTHTYPSDGVYAVEQFVTNVFGCMDSLTLDVLVHPQPQAGFANTTVCAADFVDFADTTLGNSTTWSWDFGDAIGTSTAQNPSYVYPVGGTYTITLIAGNSVGCLDTTSVDIEVFTNPIPNFAADTVCFLEVTSFTDLSNDVVPIVSWFYDFGDGINNSSLQNPTYIYQAPGLYPAVLTVTNSNGCDSAISINVVVNNIPVANFNYDTVCWGSPTTFTDVSSGSVNSWNWNFGDGNTATAGPVVQHIYSSPGSYLASMEVDGGSGCTDIVYYPVTVIDVLNPLIGADDTVCLNEPVQFLDLSAVSLGAITAWSWDFGDGTSSNLQNPVHAYSTSGIYNVTLDVQTASGCTNTGTYILEVFELPVNDFAFTIPCEGQPTIFSDNSNDPNGTIVNWQWDFGDGSPVSITSSPQHQYPAAGNYPVTSIVESSNGCYDTLTQIVTIYPSPTADFISSTVCGGLPVPFLNMSVGTIAQYDWIYQGASFSAVENPQYSFPTTTDTHTVTLVVTTDLGCVDSVTHDVITHPVVLFDYGPEITAGCPVLEVNFFDNSTTTGGGGVVNWLWSMGDSTYSFASDPIHFYEDEGTYYISLQVITAEDCIYTDSLAYGIIVYPQPGAGFYYSPLEITMLDPVVEFTNTSNGAMNVEWNFGDYDYSNDWHPTHAYTDTGYYEVTQTVYNAYGCSDTLSQWLYVHGDLVLYLPNTFTPNGDGLNEVFQLSGIGFESFELLIFDRWGTLIKTITDLNDSWNGSYRGENCQDGVYVWKLRALDFEEIPHVRTGHVTLLR